MYIIIISQLMFIVCQSKTCIVHQNFLLEPQLFARFLAESPFRVHYHQSSPFELKYALPFSLKAKKKLGSLRYFHLFPVSSVNVCCPVAIPKPKMGKMTVKGPILKA